MITVKKCALGNEQPLIISSSTSRLCYNWDNDSPIIDDGITILLSSGDIFNLWDKHPDQELIDFLKSLRWATIEEQRQFVRITSGAIFAGDEVIIKRGRKMVGEKKTVLSTFRYEVRGTYGHVGTDYVRFTDGTKVNINHCDVVGVECKLKENWRYFFTDEKLKYFLDVGGDKRY